MDTQVRRLEPSKNPIVYLISYHPKSPPKHRPLCFFTFLPNAQHPKAHTKRQPQGISLAHRAILQCPVEQQHRSHVENDVLFGSVQKCVRPFCFFLEAFIGKSWQTVFSLFGKSRTRSVFALCWDVVVCFWMWFGVLLRFDVSIV